jgi:hypothetical protein
MRVMDLRQTAYMESKVLTEEDVLLEQNLTALLVSLTRLWKHQVDKAVDDYNPPTNIPPEASGDAATGPVPA